ncbi:putative PMR5 domain, trichome birefringence-like family [Helianthus annuus]|nr:putative PMR5 domain, trichome birefringence-like family [Helianthus annuus]KAJ0676591.1 putative PMR5 domain, trichome birefringence-like family [Helianthus annuus]KAJ0679795.1 putative PMR5 domain, trichome birefringence-like family [Helianthus annuus]
MNLKKLVPISDHFPYFSFPKKKVVSGFGLGFVSFFIFLCVVFFNVSFKNPILNNSLFQGLSVKNETSVFSWSFSFARIPSINSTSVQNPLEKPIIDVKNGNFSGKKVDFEGTHLSNFTNDVKNGSFDSNSEKKTDLNDTHLSNFTSDVKNGSFDAVFKNHSGSYEECDIFNGRWVRDDTKPLYRAGSCPYIDRDFDCHLNKRPDDEYVKWKWQPFGCEIPRLAFRNKMDVKTLYRVFVLFLPIICLFPA